MWNPLDIVGSAADLAKNVMDRFWPKSMDEGEKASAAMELEKLIQARDTQLTQASRDIIVAEMQQGDKFTKRARPSIVYFGLLVIGWNYMLIPTVNRILEWITIMQGKTIAIMLFKLSPLDLPAEFWAAWGMVCSVWSIGRTMERRGHTNKIVEMITGKKK